jgi:hypothetical protein
MTNRVPMREIARLYHEGFSLEQLGKRFGESGENIRRRLLRLGVEMRPKIRKGSASNLYRGGAEGGGKYAHGVVKHAIRTGRLVPQPCEVCGSTGTCRNGINYVHAHHDDYAKPLKVRWLCAAHHHEIHVRQWKS